MLVHLFSLLQAYIATIRAFNFLPLWLIYFLYLFTIINIFFIIIFI